jgi:anti-sigma regulatory factor (Ser/Thr protein kinase)
VARKTVRDFGHKLGLSERRIDDLRTVASEACMNAAIHAYDTSGGEFEFEARASKGEVAILVSDRGEGIRPRPAFESSSARLGLLLMAALSNSLEIRHRDGGGTTVRVAVPVSH